MSQRVFIVNGKLERWAPSYDGPLFHAVLSDPPYHLLSDTRGGSPRVAGTGPYGRHRIRTKGGGGFMGAEWDGGDIAFTPGLWASLRPHLHPGAFGFAFAASRGWHRMAVAIEDAGYVFHPSVFALWAYGSGFPKATRIGAGGFEGHRYGLQALKPAVEPIICFQAPYVAAPIEDITSTGAGALNIEAGRIGSESTRSVSVRKPGVLQFDGENERPHHSGDAELRSHGSDAGRWPANFALIHSPECRAAGERALASNGHHPKARGAGSEVCGPSGHSGQTNLEERHTTGETVTTYECASGCPVAALNAQAGVRTSGANPTRRSSDKCRDVYQPFAGQAECEARRGEDFGYVSRFFLEADWSAEVAERITDSLSVRYEAKASRRERDAGVTGEAKPLLWSSGTKNPGSFQSPNTDKTARNNHPAVKPIALTRWLASLLLPPEKYAPRRLLIPFGGSGSEAIGALLAGWDEVTLIEQDEAFCAIASGRIRHHAPQCSIENLALGAEAPAMRRARVGEQRGLFA